MIKLVSQRSLNYIFMEWNYKTKRFYRADDFMFVNIITNRSTKFHHLFVVIPLFYSVLLSKK